jgi:hypothetical protein
VMRTQNDGHKRTKGYICVICAISNGREQTRTQFATGDGSVQG